MAFAEKLQLVELAQRVANASFPVGVAPWVPNGVAFNNPGAVLSRSTTEAFVGEASLKVETTEAAGAEGAETEVQGRYLAGVTYTASVYVLKNGAAQAIILAFGVGSDYAVEGVTTSAVWQRVQVSWTPKESHSAKVAVTLQQSAKAVRSWYVDAVMVNEGAAALPYAEGQLPETLIDLNDDEHFLIKTGTFKVTAPVLQRVEAADQRRWGGSRQVGETQENGTVVWEAGVAGATEQEALERVELMLAQLAGNPLGVFLLWQPPGASEPTLYEVRGTGQYEPVYDAAQFGGAQLFMVQITVPVAPLAQGLPVQVLASAETALPAVFNIPDIPGDAPAKAEVSIETGTEPEYDFISVAGEPSAVATDSTYIYWTNDIGKIGRAKLDGTEVNQSFITGCKLPQGIAVNASHIFWTNGENGSIGRATLAGAEVNQAFIVPTGENPEPKEIAVNATSIFWACFGTNHIAKAALSGTGVEETWFLTADGQGIEGIALSSTHIYWTNFQVGIIGRVTLAGTEGATLLKVTGNPTGIALNGSYIYWGTYGTRFIGRATIAGMEVLNQWLATEGPSFGLALNSEYLYWAGPFTTVGRALLEHSPPIWALLGWAVTPEAGLAVAPFGLLDSSEAVAVSEWTYQTVAGARGGKALKGKSSLASAYWNVDPATMVPDSFSGELSVEVWARVLIEGNSRNAHWIVSAQPQDGLGYGAARFTDEWGSSGRQVIASPANDLVWRMTRLGTLHLLVNPLAPRVWRIWLEGNESAGEWGVDYLLLVPSTQRACSPSGKPNNASYPVFISNVGPTVKTIRHDLSALVGKPGKYGHPDHGLGGQLLELPPGDTDLLVKCSSLIPDQTPEEESPATEQLAHEATVSVTIVPRYFLTQA